MIGPTRRSSCRWTDATLRKTLSPAPGTAAAAPCGVLWMVVEQNLAATLPLMQRVYIINNGHIAREGPAQEIKAQPELLQRYPGA